MLRPAPPLFVLTLAAVLAAAAFAPAQEGGEETVMVRLRSGDVLTGTVVAVEDDGVIMISAGARLKIENGRIEPASLYRLHEKRTPEDDAAAQAKLARLCLEVRLWSLARKHARAARSLDEAQADAALEVQERADQGEALDLLAEGRRHLESKKYDEAVAVFRRLLGELPHTQAAEDGRKLLAEAAEKIREGEAGGPAAGGADGPAAGGPGAGAGGPGAGAPAADPDDPKVPAALDAADGKVRTALARKAEGLTLDGEGKTSKAERAFLDALAELEGAVELYRGAGERSKLTERVERAGDGVERCRELRLLTCMDLAHLAATNRNFNDITKWTNEVLKIEPAHRLALDLRTTVDQERIRFSARERSGLDK